MNKSYWVLALSFVLLACNAATEKEGVEAAVTSEESGVQLPSFAMRNGAGATVDLQSLKGKKVFLNLWATWCPPCRAELPSLQRLHSKLDTSKVAFVFLSLDENFEEAITYFREKGFAMPLYAPVSTMPGLLNVPSIPTTFIFNEEGKLIREITGSDDYDQPKYHQLLN